MKKSALLFGLMIVSTIMFAQQKERDPKAMAARQSERMKTELALNDSQYASVKAINEEYASKQSQLRSDSSASKDVRREQMQQLRNEQDSKIKAVLTEDQVKKWEALRAEQKKKRGS